MIYEILSYKGSSLQIRLVITIVVTIYCIRNSSHALLLVINDSPNPINIPPVALLNALLTFSFISRTLNLLAAIAYIERATNERNANVKVKRTNCFAKECSKAINCGNRAI